MLKKDAAPQKIAVRGSRTGRPIMALLDLLGRRWTLRIIWELRDGPPIRCATISPPSATCSATEPAPRGPSGCANGR